MYAMWYWSARTTLDEGDGFPVEEWRERYAEALKWSQRYEALYPSPGERVHQIQRHLIEQRP